MPSKTEVYEAMESSLRARAEELTDEGKQPSDEPIQVLNDIVTPLLMAAKQGAELANWNAKFDGTPVDPTVQIEFWTDEEDRQQAASVMFCTDSNEFIDSRLAMSYSIAGSNSEKATSPLPLHQYSPGGACTIIEEMIRKALVLDSATS